MGFSEGEIRQVLLKSGYALDVVDSSLLYERSKRLFMLLTVWLMVMLVVGIGLLVFQPFKIPSQSLWVGVESEVITPVVQSGSDLEFVVALFPSDSVAVELEHRVVDSGGRLVVSLKETLYVAEAVQHGVTMKIPPTAESGPAQVRTGVRYGSRFSLSSAQFNISAG